MNSNLAHKTVLLASRGIAVFPLTPGSKIPLPGSHGHLDSTTDADIVREWWAKHPRANIGAATGSRSSFWCLDIEPRHGGDGSLTALEHEHGGIPLTIESATPSGGRHLFFRWPVSGPVIRNSVGRVGPGFDVRGEGGSVVVPPSTLSGGRRYTWTRNGAHEFADAPVWLLQRAARKPEPPSKSEPRPISSDASKYVAAALVSEFQRLKQAVPGGRNDSLNRASFAAGQFVAIGAVPEDWVTAQLESRAIAIGLPVTEARRTITSGLAAGLAHPRELQP